MFQESYSSLKILLTQICISVLNCFKWVMRSLFIGSLLNWHLHGLKPFCTRFTREIEAVLPRSGQQAWVNVRRSGSLELFSKTSNGFWDADRACSKMETHLTYFGLLLLGEMKYTPRCLFSAIHFPWLAYWNCKFSTFVVSLYKPHPRAQIGAGKWQRCSAVFSVCWRWQ